MEWMRCNSCWFKVENRSSQFHLTQCGHVYCDKCITKAEEKCIQCGSVDIVSLPLKEPLSPQIAHYFSRPNDLLEKVVQAQQFQQSQLTLCLKRADENESKYQSVKEAYWVSAENLKKVFQKYNQLKMTLSMMQKRDKKIESTASTFTPSQYRTPPSQISNPKNQNSYQHGYYGQKNVQGNGNRGDEVFRVPTSTRVPRSAQSAGYYTASSTSSTSSDYRMGTPKSHYSNY